MCNEMQATTCRGNLNLTDQLNELAAETQLDVLFESLIRGLEHMKSRLPNDTNKAAAYQEIISHIEEALEMENK